MTVENRENSSDSRFAPLVHYVYILRLDDESFYIGQTNDLSTRFAEHSIDSGAQATKSKTPRLVWFSHTHDRNSAHQMEQRLQSALARSPLAIEEIVDRFSGLLDLIRPQKTLADLRREEQEFESEMSGAFHHVPIRIGQSSATCGWTGSAAYPCVYGTGDWQDLFQMKREQDALEAVGGKYPHRPPCRLCLAKAPSSLG